MNCRTRISDRKQTEALYAADGIRLTVIHLMNLKRAPNRVLFFIYNRYACPAFGGSMGVDGDGKVNMPVSGSKISDFWLKIEQNAWYEILWIVDII